MNRQILEQAMASTGRIVDGVSAGDLAAPTPCTAWDVRDLMSHLVGTLYLGAGLLSGQPPTVEMGPGTLPASDVLGDDPAASYRAGAAALLAAATDENLAGVAATPMGEMPRSALAGFTALDIAVHGWDLAVATGQDARIDPDLVAAIDGFARQAINDDMRGGIIGPEVSTEAGASQLDRLVGFLGRTP